MNGSNKEDILKKAISKATVGGWGPNEYDLMDLEYIGRTWPIIFYSKPFAEALWPGYIDVGTGKIYKTWPGGFPVELLCNYHRARMVVAPNPLKYLGDNI